MKPIAREPSLKQILGALMMTGATATAQGAGFAIIEQNASGMGNAYAGAAASAEDASTVYFNPAGLMQLQSREMVFAGHIISPQAEFSDSNSRSGTGAPLGGTDGGDGGETAFVPNFYYAQPMNNDWTVGLGVNAPFGLETDYDDGWIGRYHALKSELITININPSLAYRFNDRLSFGFGVSYQKIDAKLTNALDFGSICISALTPSLGSQAAAAAACGASGITPLNSDGMQSFQGDDWSWGYNLGLLYEASESTRIGIAYRSSIKHELDGTVDITTPAGLPAAVAASAPDQGVTANIELPETLSVSLYHEINDRWTLLADYTRTRWSRFDELKIVFDQGVLGQPSSTQPENWDDNNRYSVGATYKVDAQWKLRGGLAYDETPIPNATLRTPRIPGNDRTWVSMGFSYTPTSVLTVDAGYSHLFINDPAINTTDITTGHVLQGSYDAAVDIVSAQVVWRF